LLRTTVSQYSTFCKLSNFSPDFFACWVHTSDLAPQSAQKLYCQGLRTKFQYPSGISWRYDNWVLLHPGHASSL
jgi:hypothetical protein